MDGLVSGVSAKRETSAGRLVVYTTIYPGVERFLPEWYRSVRSQSDQDFDLCIGLDTLVPEQVAAAFGDDRPVAWIAAGARATPAKIREQAIVQMVNEYAGVIFVDSDDVLLPDRVAAARAALERCDVGACALRIVDERGTDLNSVFGPRGEPVWSEFLPRHNVFGLSNTAYRSAVLRECLPVPAECVLLDWLLATRAWLLGARLEFDREPRMQYRQYGDNVARVMPPFGGDDVLRAAERVLLHYECLFDPAWPIPRAHRPRLEAERERVRGFLSAIQASRAVLEAYVEELNRRPACYVWWWCVAHPDLEWQWTN
jgi:hypothetical protein